MRIYLILHNVRSAHNVGAIFRTADGAGVTKIFLAGYTPAPIDRFGREVDEMKKTSLGATSMVPYEQCEDTLSCIKRLQAEGVRVIALEQHPDSVSYTNVTYNNDVAIVVGNEVEGVPLSVCDACNAVVHIPMHGKKESLNVSTATGIVLFHARTRCMPHAKESTV